MLLLQKFEAWNLQLYKKANFVKSISEDLEIKSFLL